MNSPGIKIDALMRNRRPADAEFTGVVANPAAAEQIVDPARLQHGELDVIVAMRTRHPVRRGITHVKPQSDEIDMFGKLSRHDVRKQNKVAQRASFTSMPILVR